VPHEGGDEVITTDIPRARQHAATLAIAARTDDGARAALLDYLAESDDPELRDRAELARLTEEIAATAQELNREKDGNSPHWDTLATAQHRIASLQSRLSAWPCPECRESGQVYDPRDRTTRPLICPSCGGTGDVLRWRHEDNIGSGYVRTSVAPISLAWDCGYPRWVTLPTTDDAVRVKCRSCGREDRGVWCQCGEPLWPAPTPRLRALAAVPPWGAPLEGVRVADKRPYRVRPHGSPNPYCYRGVKAGEFQNDGHLIPDFLVRMMDAPESAREGDCPMVWYLTESAAVDALARAVITFAREYQ
jgi:ribosomal protein S27E